MNSNRKISIIECPRDAMQGLTYPISTQSKVRYLQSLLNVGFDVLDAVSFVSPKAIPQMADSIEVLEQLDLSGTNTEILAIVLNQRGALIAAKQSKVSIIGYPLSICETFQQRNAKQSIQEAMLILDQIISIAKDHNKKLVIYLSMGFGNPYGDAWSPLLTFDFTMHYLERTAATISLADTAGDATPETIKEVLNQIPPVLLQNRVSIHLHSNPNDQESKILAAINMGCNRFDSTIGGYGGCPFAKDHLVGNINTQDLYNTIVKEGHNCKVIPEHLQTAVQESKRVFK
jgi:hydroxymethylglutaryl-CoA lyase